MSDSHLFLEGYGAPARERLLRLVTTAKRDDLLHPVTVVVPSPYAGLSLRRSLGRMGPGLINVRFMVLPRLAEYLGSPALAAAGKAPLVPLVELATIRAILAESPGTLGPLAANPRLHASLQRTFGDLDRLTPVALSELAEVDGLRKQIVEWRRLCRERLSRYYHREELAKEAGNAVAGELAEASLRDLGLIVFFLVHDLSPAEKALVQALGMRGLCSLILGLTGEDTADHAALRLAHDLEAALGAAQVMGDDVEGKRATQLVMASDAHEEVRWVIRDIVRRAEAGTAFRSIAVLYRQSAPYAALVQTQLRLAGVPAAGPESRRLADTPAGKLLILLLRTLANDLSRGSLMHWLGEAPVMADDGVSGELARWEIISRDAGIVKGAEQWRERLRSYQAAQAMRRPEDASPEQLARRAEMAASSGRLLTFIEGLIGNQPPAAAFWEAYCRWARDMMRRYGPREWPADQQSAFERILQLLEELSALDGVVPSTDREGFRFMLEEALAAPAGRSGPTGSGVFVAPIGLASGMEFDVAYVVGMAEGVFPPQLPEDPLLPDSLRQDVSDGPLPLRGARRARERRLFLAAMAAANDCILSYPRADPSAQRGQHPSRWFLAEAGRLAGRSQAVSSSEVGRLAGEPWMTVIESAEDGLRLAAELAPADEHDHDLASLAAWRAKALPTDQHFLARDGSALGRAIRMERARRGGSFTIWDGQVSPLAGSSSRLSLPMQGTMSASRLERWATCPFGYFLEYVLRLSPLETPEKLLTISALERGGLMHGVLESFVSAAIARGEPGFGLPWGESDRKRMAEIAEEKFAEWEERGITGRRLLWDVAKREMRQDLLAFLDEDSRMRAQRGSRPVAVEQWFGGNGSVLPEVSIALPGGPVLRLRGIIDRVDETADGSRLIVMDYKTGKHDDYDGMKKDPLDGGRHLQLPIYAMAAQAGSTRETEAFYWFVTTRGNFQQRGLTLSEVRGRLPEVLGIISSGIQQGLFPANPGASGWGGGKNCHYCKFKPICPSNTDELWERKSMADELEPYRRLMAGCSEEDQE